MLYGYAIQRAMAKDIFGGGRETIVRVAENPQPPTIKELRRDLVRDLMGILRPAHNHNVERSPSSSPSSTPTSSSWAKSAPPVVKLVPSCRRGEAGNHLLSYLAGWG